MNIGPLSEWVTAFAEIIAVCVALFLPTITKARDSKRRQRKFSHLIVTLATKAQNGDQGAKKELASFVRVSLYILESEREDEIIQVGNQINDLLSQPSLSESDQTSLQKLIDQLKP